MQKAKDILQQMGFNENAPESLKRAFLKHLEMSMPSSNNIIHVTPQHKKLEEVSAEKDVPEQMEFDLA